VLSLANTRPRVLLFAAMLALLPTGMIAIPAAVTFAAETACPSGGTPPPGSTVDGGLDVDGRCILDNVTVNGGITVEAGGHLQLTNSTINGGIDTLPCGELDVNANLSSGTPTGTTSTINGGIDIEAPGSLLCPPGAPPGAFSAANIWTAQITGGISITGTFGSSGLPKICGNQITGGLHLQDVNPAPLLAEAFIGDPVDGPFGCPGNTIAGSIHLTNSSIFVVESNDIGGSVFLNGDIVELNGNTIGGSLRCSNGTVILPGEATDPTGNTVHGKNTC
jgi:hypothetical protein